jgi:hypothetical protein
MTDILLQIGVSKPIISLGLAGVAWSIQRWRGPVRPRDRLSKYIQPPTRDD